MCFRWTYKTFHDICWINDLTFYFTHDAFGWTSNFCLHCTHIHLISLSMRAVFNQARYLQLLAEDPSLKRFKSHKKSVWRLKRIGDVLTIVVVAGKLMSHPRVSPPLIHARMCAFTVDGIHQFYKFLQCNFPMNFKADNLYADPRNYKVLPDHYLLC